MIQHDITKLCADSLRFFVQNNHGTKLGASHAHEIVAAFFGYQSRAALLADTNYPVSSLQQAEFICFDMNLSLVNSRIKELQLDLPDAMLLAEGFYAPLIAEKWLSEKIWPSFHDLAIHLAEQRLQEWGRMWRMSPAPKWDMDVDIKHKPDGVILTVDVGYRTDKGDRLRHKQFGMSLLRIAASMGYGKPHIHETSYNGQFRDPNFNPDFGIRGIAG